MGLTVVICWKIRIFAYWTTPLKDSCNEYCCCDLLKNSYLCLLNNTTPCWTKRARFVVICWKIRIFAYWTTPNGVNKPAEVVLWFAEKFVSLLIEQHPHFLRATRPASCDLLKNSYLCLLNNTTTCCGTREEAVVICWKIRIFAYWTTPIKIKVSNPDELWFAEKFVSLLIEQHRKGFAISLSLRCDLLKNSYLCLLNNTYNL